MSSYPVPVEKIESQLTYAGNNKPDANNSADDSKASTNNVTATITKVPTSKPWLCSSTVVLCVIAICLTVYYSTKTGSSGSSNPVLPDPAPNDNGPDLPAAAAPVRGHVQFSKLARERFPHGPFKSSVAFFTGTKPSDVSVTSLSDAASRKLSDAPETKGSEATFTVEATTTTAQLIFATLDKLSKNATSTGRFVTRLQKEVKAYPGLSAAQKSAILSAIENGSITLTALAPSSSSNYSRQCSNMKFDPAFETDVDCGGQCGPCPGSYICGSGSDCSTGFNCKVPPITTVSYMRKAEEHNVLLADAARESKKSVLLEDNADSTNAAAVVRAANTIPTPSPTTPGQYRPKVCVKISCDNGVIDGAESDTDCGGTCSQCRDFKKCNNNADCISDSCAPHNSVGDRLCQPLESCFDGLMNSNETDVDCGGTCDKCDAYQSCKVNNDCNTALCNDGGRCDTGTSCFNGIRDGTETDIDCGGSCPKCRAFYHCLNDSDCVDNSCHGGDSGVDASDVTGSTQYCQAESCFDGMLGGTETDIDCGGDCRQCPSFYMCIKNEDCVTKECNMFHRSEAEGGNISTCGATAYPTNAPTQIPTLANPAAFSSGTIIATLPDAFVYDSSKQTSCADIPGGLFNNWQRDPTVSADNWFGCQFLSQPFVGARSVLGSMPGGSLRVPHLPTFTRESRYNMIADGCYSIQVLPQSKTLSTVRHWASAAEYESAVSSSWGFQQSSSSKSGFMGTGHSTASAYQQTSASSTASARSNSNVGAVIGREIQIAVITNTCLSPKGYKSLAKYVNPGLIKKAKELADAIPDGSYAINTNPSLVKLTEELLAYGSLLPYKWTIGHYYIYDLTLMFASSSSMSTLQASQAMATASNTDVVVMGKGNSQNIQQNFQDAAGSSAAGSYLQIDIETSGKCPWYPNQDTQTANADPANATPSPSPADGDRSLMSALHKRSSEGHQKEGRDTGGLSEFAKRTSEGTRKEEGRGHRLLGEFASEAEKLAEGEGEDAAKKEAEKKAEEDAKKEAEEAAEQDAKKEAEKKRPGSRRHFHRVLGLKEDFGSMLFGDDPLPGSPEDSASSAKENTLPDSDGEGGKDDGGTQDDKTKDEQDNKQSKATQNTMSSQLSPYAPLNGMPTTTSMLSQVQGTTPANFGGIDPATYDTTSGLQYQAWQNCDTDNFEVWGGITPRAADGGISSLVDRLNLTVFDTMKIINAEYSVTARHSGWYGYTTMSGELPKWKKAAQKAADTYSNGQYENGLIQFKTCHQTNGAIYDADFCDAHKPTPSIACKYMATWADVANETTWSVGDNKDEYTGIYHFGTGWNATTKKCPGTSCYSDTFIFDQKWCVPQQRVPYTLLGFCNRRGGQVPLAYIPVNGETGQAGEEMPSSTECSSDYGTSAICCDQGGTPSPKVHQCPSDYPSCRNYVEGYSQPTNPNSHYGSCYKPTALPVDSVPIAAKLMNVNTVVFCGYALPMTKAPTKAPTPAPTPTYLGKVDWNWDLPVNNGAGQQAGPANNDICGGGPGPSYSLSKGWTTNIDAGYNYPSPPDMGGQVATCTGVSPGYYTSGLFCQVEKAAPDIWTIQVFYTSSSYGLKDVVISGEIMSNEDNASACSEVTAGGAPARCCFFACINGQHNGNSRWCE